jgi:hypothetical protein
MSLWQEFPSLMSLWQEFPVKYTRICLDYRGTLFRLEVGRLHLGKLPMEGLYSKYYEIVGRFPKNLIRSSTRRLGSGYPLGRSTWSGTSCDSLSAQSVPADPCADRCEESVRTQRDRDLGRPTPFGFIKWFAATSVVCTWAITNGGRRRKGECEEDARVETENFT